MGWTYLAKPRNVKAYLNDMNTYETDKRKCVVIQSAIVNMREYYAALEVTNKETGEVYVTALVFMLNYVRGDYYDFGYKDMEENMGPYQCNCPVKILKLLTPTVNEYAKQWREKCHANAVRGKAVKDGDKIKFSYELTFTDGSKGDTFTIRKQGRSVCFVGSDGGRYRITGWKKRDYVVV